MADIVMPRLSDSMEEGTILQWLKELGDDVAIGDELVEIETDKANMAYESDVAGTLAEILVQEGETVPIGTPIARVGEGSEAVGRNEEGTERSAAGPVAAGDPPPPPVAKASSGAGPPTAPPAEGAINASSTPNGGGRPKASPIARRLAKEKGLDLSELQGSGPGGRIVKADVEKAGASAGADGGGTPAPSGSESGTAATQTGET
jgi:pyruvate dehydrogenase E2 component (dihydrolipoyllysine-residue acetyltransferase)